MQLMLIMRRNSRKKLLVFGRCRRFSGDVNNASSQTALSKLLKDKTTAIAKQFDQLLGIAEVRIAQSLVHRAEEEFMNSRKKVHEARTELLQRQGELREARVKLDRTSREDERYLTLATEEHRILIEERKIRSDLERLVASERDKFAALSAAVRKAHEQERSRAERTKYWSVIGSACGAVLGILGSSLVNVKRMRQMKVTVEENNEAFVASVMEKLRTLQSEQVNLALVEESRGENRSAKISEKNSREVVLSEIHGKLETLSQDHVKSMGRLASEIQNLKNEMSGNLRHFEAQRPTVHSVGSHGSPEIPWRSSPIVIASFVGLLGLTILFSLSK